MIVRYDSVSELPNEWDSVVGDNIYLTRKFLAFMETADREKKTITSVCSRG